jgi:SHS2 domain-containing protein
MLLVTWLEEILYRHEVHDQWFLEGAMKIEEVNGALTAVAQVTWVVADEVERELEIKAVTTHLLAVDEVKAGVTVSSPDPDVPEFQGPGWYCDVVFDI